MRAIGETVFVHHTDSRSRMCNGKGCEMNDGLVKKVGGVAILAGLVACSVCSAQGREKRFEIAAIGHWLGGASETVGGFTAEEDDWFLYGVQLGWNATDHWNINTDLSYGSIDVTGAGTVRGTNFTAQGDQNTFLWMVNVDYNILTGQFTPFVTGGVGWGYSSGDVSVTGGGVTVATSVDTSGFAWNVGGGARWDITENLFAKVFYRIIWDEADNRSGVAFSLGWMFD